MNCEKCNAQATETKTPTGMFYHIVTIIFVIYLENLFFMIIIVIESITLRKSDI